MSLTWLAQSRRNTFLVSTAVLVSSYAMVRYRQEQDKKRNAGTFHVDPHRSGALMSTDLLYLGPEADSLQVAVFEQLGRWCLEQLGVTIASKTP